MKQWPDSIVVFDGACNLCTWSVSFIIRHDKCAHFGFASLQSEAGQQICGKFGINPGQFDTVLLVQNGTIISRSDAVIAIAKMFGGPWRLMALARFVPRCVRDWMYAIVARYRYQWFGRKTACIVPSGEIRHRFIE